MKFIKHALIIRLIIDIVRDRDASPSDLAIAINSLY